VYTESAAALALSVVAEADSILAVRALRCSACGTAEVYIDGRPIVALEGGVVRRGYVPGAA
ncbi:MAG: hypothetical protein ACO2PN_23490, partial [Pyrobaculum sp.]